MRFWNYKSQDFYIFYERIFDSDFPIEKKKIILRSLFTGEYFLSNIICISKVCFEEYKKNNFKKILKPKKVNKRIIRHQFTNFNDTINLLLEEKLLIKNFWKKIYQSEKTHLITKSEKDKKEYLYIDIPEEGGYFLNKTVGYEYGKKEELFLKYINSQKIKWKKIKLTEITEVIKADTFENSFDKK